MSRLVRGAAALALVLAAGCSSEDAAAPPGDQPLSLLVTREDAGPGAACALGGSIVRAGLDANRNGVLEPAEVVRTETICDEPPPAVLTRTAVEQPGGTCPAGGTRVESGGDANGNGVLDDGEVQQTAAVCAAPNPEPPPVLTRVDPELPGANCVAGGSAVRFGPDADGDGLLSDAEVAGVQFVCETRSIGWGFVVRNQADADLVSSADFVNGSLVVEIADPLAVDLSPTAVQGSIHVRSPGLAELGLYPWLIGGNVVVEGNPGLTRFWMGSHVLGGSVVVRDNPVLDSLVLPTGDYTPFHYPANVLIQRNPRLQSFGFLSPVEVSGDLVLDGNAGLRRLDLGGLARVGGNFVLAGNDAMERYPDYTPSPLTTVGGIVDVRDNSALFLFTLPYLETAGGLRIARNASLHTAYFPKLPVVLGDIVVEDNPVLHLADSPEDPLQFVTGSVSVRRNADLRSLQQWNALVHVGQWMEVTANPMLQRLGLVRLESASYVAIADCPSIASIGPTPGNPGLEPPALVSLEGTGSMVVSRNAALRQLILPAMRQVGSLTVEQNPLLPTCQAMAIPATYRYVSGNDDAATCP